MYPLAQPVQYSPYSRILDEINARPGLHQRNLRRQSNQYAHELLNLETEKGQ
jgi:hypothetical protein